MVTHPQSRVWRQACCLKISWSVYNTLGSSNLQIKQLKYAFILWTIGSKLLGQVTFAAGLLFLKECCKTPKLKTIIKSAHSFCLRINFKVKYKKWAHQRGSEKYVIICQNRFLQISSYQLELFQQISSYLPYWLWQKPSSYTIAYHISEKYSYFLVPSFYSQVSYLVPGWMPCWLGFDNHLEQK